MNDPSWIEWRELPSTPSDPSGLVPHAEELVPVLVRMLPSGAIEETQISLEMALRIERATGQA